jgi:hypothetical protein
MPKKTGLREALAQVSAPVTRQTIREAGAQASGVPTQRVGRVHIGSYFAPEVQQSLRLIQARQPSRTVHDVLVEALNDLCAKYDVPQCAHNKP